MKVSLNNCEDCARAPCYQARDHDLDHDIRICDTEYESVRVQFTTTDIRNQTT